jgi:hypothetical protein
VHEDALGRLNGATSGASSASSAARLGRERLSVARLDAVLHEVLEPQRASRPSNRCRNA